MLCLPGGLATAPFYDDVLAEPALAASGVRAIATTLPGFSRVPFPPGFDASVEAYAAFAGNLARDLGCHAVVCSRPTGSCTPSSPPQPMTRSSAATPAASRTGAKRTHPNGKSSRFPSSTASLTPYRPGTGCSCSWQPTRACAGGELIALRRDSLDLDAGTIRITRTTAQLDGGRLQPDTPKSRAGRRTVAVPADLIPELRWHLERYAEPGSQGLVFVGPKGAPLRRNNFLRIWVRACTAADAPGVHLHDLRHIGGTMAATTGATLKELMARLGHSSPRAAMIYQHATSDRDQAIAQALGILARQAHAQRGQGPDK